MDTELEKSTYSAFERFLYWFFIPIVFTVVLVGALLSLFDYDVMNQVLKVGNKIPIVNTVLPEPKADPKAATATQAEKPKANETSQESLESVVDKLKKELAAKDAELQAADSAYQQKDQALKEMQAKFSAYEEQVKTKAKTDAEYEAQIQQMASMYAKMTPSKAAPILESMTLQEQVLVMGQMKPDERVKILEKMDAKKAADVSISLKDVVPAKDRQIAALQERLKLNEDTKSKTNADAQKMSKSDLGQTFANMTADSAATLLIEMEKANSAKVTEILNATDNQARSKIMSAIAKQSKETAATITGRLAP